MNIQPKGINIRASQYSVKETVDRLIVFLQQHGVIVYGRINQQLEVHNAGMEISPLEFILFGNPKAGGPIMASNPLAALDLPLKIIAWEDAEKKVWLGYNTALYIEERYGLPHALTQPLDLDPMITKALMG